MSKELRALEALGNYEIAYDETNDYTWTLSDTEDFDIIKKALTPPTKEEVCDLLGKRLGLKVIFENKRFYIDYGKTRKLIIDYFNSNGKHCSVNILMRESLTPKILIAISRFYEGGTL